MKNVIFIFLVFGLIVGTNVLADRVQGNGNAIFAERRGGYSPELSAKDWIRPEEVVGLIRDIDFSTFSRKVKVEKIYQLVRENFQFIPESPGEDFWQFPSETIRRGAGDCEDLSFLIVSLLIAAGVPEEVIWLNIMPYHMYVSVIIEGETLILETDPDSTYIYESQIRFNRLFFEQKK